MTMRKEPVANSNQTDPEHVAQLMEGLRHGNKEAAGQLVAIFYPELRRLARSRMRSEQSPHTWQPTALINELYLELVKIKALSAAGEGRSDREDFLAIAAHIMKRMLVHHARPLYRQAQAVDLSAELDLNTSTATDLADLETLLFRLSSIDPQLRTIVEMRVFEGFSIAEIALELNCAPRTVDRRWSFARKWLEHQLAPKSQS